MLEDLLADINVTKEPFKAENLQKHIDFVEQQRKASENRRKQWEQVKQGKNFSPLEKDVADYIIQNELNMSYVLSTIRVLDAFANRHIYATEWAVSILDIVIKGIDKLEKENVKETIVELRQQFVNFQKDWNDNKEYIGIMKDAVELKKKWMNDGT
jgi:hypothetical protein